MPACATPLAARLATTLAITLATTAQAQTWFVPPPAGARNVATMDMTVTPDSQTITVIGKRHDRSWRTQVAAEHLNDPRSSEAARPRHSFESAPAYCNSSLRTVGGQPASAGDLMVGGGAGAC